MSQSYNVTKKHNRRALDAANPERKRIRRMIRSGKLPVRAFNKDASGRPIMRIQSHGVSNFIKKTITGRRIYLRPWSTYDVFRTLTSASKS